MALAVAMAIMNVTMPIIQNKATMIPPSMDSQKGILGPFPLIACDMPSKKWAKPKVSVNKLTIPDIIRKTTFNKTGTFKNGFFITYTN